MTIGYLKTGKEELTLLTMEYRITRFEAELGKQVTAAATSQLARLLGTDGALVTRMLLACPQ